MTFFQKEARNQIQVIFLLLVLICNKCSEKILGNLFQKFINKKKLGFKKTVKLWCLFEGIGS